MPVPMPNGKQAYFSSSGTPLVGGRLYTYAAGTSTPKATWSDAAGTTPNTNPVVLDARGEAVIFFSGAYKLELRDAANAVIWSVDQFVAADSSVITPDGRTTLPSATTVDLGGTTVRSVDITGLAAIQSFGSSAADGVVRLLRFTGACSLVYNATSMILPGGQNISVSAGDTAIVQSLGGGNWVFLNYLRAARFDENDRRAATVASAATTDLSTTIGRSLDISGTATITSFGTAPAGTWRMLRFLGVATLTYNATSMILPGQQSITTAAGDTCTVISLGSGNWLVTDYTRAITPSFLAFRSSALTGVSSISGLSLGTQGANEGNALNLTTGVFTAPSAGLYTFTASISLTNLTAAGITVAGGWFGSTGSIFQSTSTTVPASASTGLTQTVVKRLAAGDTMGFGFVTGPTGSTYQVTNAVLTGNMVR